MPEQRAIRTDDVELGPTSQADFKCPECGDLLSIYSDWTPKVKCTCGFVWTVKLSAMGIKWVDSDA